ncbi:hypothetical protein RIF29_21158 [Crotalaria pallida]|uniref:Methylmalonate-semialdehyde dehydrogenase (CoA acylating) n=1 Tax=Crotalaria pallida TaxID=3830 RepID=A0AAN9F487_CROPI
MQFKEFGNANVDATLNALVAAGFGAAGQRCMALSTVVFVGGSQAWYFYIHKISIHYKEEASSNSSKKHH